MVSFNSGRFDGQSLEHLKSKIEAQLESSGKIIELQDNEVRLMIKEVFKLSASELALLATSMKVFAAMFEDAKEHEPFSLVHEAGVDADDLKALCCKCFALGLALDSLGGE